MIKNTLFLCTAGPDSLDGRIFGILLLLSKLTAPVERRKRDAPEVSKGRFGEMTFAA